MIRLQFSRQSGLISNAIAWFSAGHFSHVDAVLPDGNLLGARHDRVGGKPPGVQVRPQDYVEFSEKRLFFIPAPPEQARMFYDFLLAQVGKPYDIAAIWGFALDRDWRNPDSWICSELQAAALEQVGRVPRLFLAANKITPGALALVVTAIGGRAERRFFL
jgi:hypothetical protein